MKTADGLTAAELKALSVPVAWRTWLQIGWAWACMALTVAGALWLDNTWALVLAIPLMARHQLCLGALMHEGAHRRLFVSRAWNDHVAQVLLGGPLMLVSDGYRRTHLKHHRRTMHEDDPDIGISGGYPVAQASLWRRLFRDITGQTYIKFVRHFILPSKRTARVSTDVLKAKRRDKGVSLTVTVCGIVAVHGALLVGFSWWASPWMYLVLWLIPQATFLQVFLRIRGIAEHATFGPSDDPLDNTRTVVNPWQTWWVAPLNLAYHIEHHLYPSVPSFRLHEVHEVLKARGVLDRAYVYDGYGPVLRELLRLEAPAIE